MATLEWPPYAGSALPGQGTVIQRVRAALATQGQKLEVTFLPWQRALLLVDQDAGFVAYGPAYQDSERSLHFYTSQEVGYGPLGLAYHKEKPIHWQTLADLQQYRIGVVRDYVNTAEFDSAVKAGLQPVDEADADRQNLLKLAYGRVDGVLIDLKVMQYWMDHDTQLRPFLDRLVASPKVIEKKALYINFHRDAEGKHWRDVLNKGLEALRVKGQ